MKLKHLRIYIISYKGSIIKVSLSLLTRIKRDNKIYKYKKKWRYSDDRSL